PRAGGQVGEERAPGGAVGARLAEFGDAALHRDQPGSGPPSGQVAGLEAASDEVGARRPRPSREQQQRRPRAERDSFHSFTVLGEVARGFPRSFARSPPSAREGKGSRGLSQEEKRAATQEEARPGEAAAWALLRTTPLGGLVSRRPRALPVCGP